MGIKKEKRGAARKLIVTTFIALAVCGVLASSFFSDIISLQAPKGQSANSLPLFKWSSWHGYSYYDIILDDNPTFTSPLTEKTTLHQYQLDGELVQGTYYWKVIGHDRNENTDSVHESSVQHFTIDSVVSVARSDYGLRNTANIVLVANLFARGLFTGRIVLDINKLLAVNETVTEVEVSQK